MDESKYLYHYTNIETLALILKNRTIRFNSLDRMDDLQEQQTADVKNIGQFGSSNIEMGKKWYENIIFSFIYAIISMKVIY